MSDLSPLRRLFNRTVSTFLYGVNAPTWWRLLRENRFAVDPEYAPRASLITLASLYNSVLGAREERCYGAAVAATPLQPPLIIVGHWRTGTTLLHRLLAQDPRFAYPNLHQVRHPHTFLSSEALHTRLAERLLPRTRPADSMAVGHHLPEEDEFALANLTGYSLIVGGIFPRHLARFVRYLSFRDAPAAELASWKRAYLYFLKKLTWKYGRPLALKSPYHTARLRLLLDLLPGVRFVHLVRNPYEVFQSTVHSTSLASVYNRVQHAKRKSVPEYVLQRHELIYDAYFEERSLVPPSRLFELRFEELERRPLETMRSLYAHLELPDFAVAEPRLERYLASIAGHQKNRFPDLTPELRQRVARVWRRSFEAWGYPV